MKETSLLSAALLLLLGAQTAQAAAFLNYCNGKPTGHQNASLTLSASSAGFPAGGMWDTSLRIAISRINDNPSRFRITSLTNNDTSVAIGNGQSEIWWSGSSVYSPAVTYNYYSCNTATGASDITESDTVFYNGTPYTNNMAVSNRLYGYGGSLRPFETTAVHELGHALGLGHVNTEYNIMGTDYYFMTTNGGVARSYMGADASDGTVQIYGSSSSAIQDLSLSHWKYLGANGAYSSHTKTILTNASGSELPSTVDGGEKRYSVTNGQSVQLELTAENNGQSVQNVRIGYYLSTDNTISTSDTLITTETRSISLGNALTFRKALTLPTGLAAGKYWLGAIINDNYAISERTYDNNAMYIQVAYTDGGGGGGLSACTSSRTDELGQNCYRSNQSVSTSGGVLYYFVFIPTGTTQLKISTSGGTGNADLYYGATTWPTPTSYTQRSINAGNSEVITVSNPPSNTYVYISLNATAPFSGVTISTEF